MAAAAATHAHQKGQQNLLGKRKNQNSSSAQSQSAKRRELEEQRRSLPIASAEEKLVQAVRENDTLIVIGETGSGKTTQLPQFLDRAGLCGAGRAIGVTQPRRVAAVTVASRVADEMGVNVGQEVGYSVRFDDMTSQRTRVKYMTDGMLLREALLDPSLSRYSVIIVDEAHERTVHTDVLLGLLKGVQARRRSGAGSEQRLNSGGTEDCARQHKRYGDNDEGADDPPPVKVPTKGGGERGEGRSANGAVTGSIAGGRGGGSRKPLPPLKLVVMSATLDARGFSAFFGGARIAYVQGRQFPVQVLYTYQPEPDYLDAALITTLQIHVEEAPGDVLVFLTGQEEIEAMERLLKERTARLPATVQKIVIAPIYAALPSEQQMRVFEPTAPGTRKVILATNIAETSLTIPNIRYVVDPGLVKARMYNARVGVESLAVVPISKAQARQRSGRAGREAAGKCFRLYTETTFQGLDDTTVPEIKRSNLASVVLQLKALGIDDVLSFDFMDKPPKSAVMKSLELLLALGALTEDGGLSDPLGRHMARLPLEPTYSKAVLASAAFGCAEEMLSAVAMLSVESIFYAPKEHRAEANAAHKRFMSPEGDHVTLVCVFRAYVEEATNGRALTPLSNQGTPGGDAPPQERQANRHSWKDATWCRTNFVNARAMRKAVDVYRQIRAHVEGMEMVVASCGDDFMPFRRCLAASFFLNAAKKQPDGTYRALGNGQTVAIHPSSGLFGKKPECVIFNELVRTNKQYVRDVTRIDPLWLAELAPQFYTTVHQAQGFRGPTSAPGNGWH